MRPGWAPRRRRAAASLAAVALVAALAWLWRPQPPDPAPDQTGDPALAEGVRRAAGDTVGYRGLAVAVVDHDGVRTAGVGRTGGAEDRPVTAATPFEIGSVTKALTGLLLAALAEDGAVAPDEAAAPLVGSEAAEPDGERSGDTAWERVTLEDLATHHAGLPRVGGGPVRLTRMLAAQLGGANPYAGVTAAEVVAQARSAVDAGEPRFAYSNLGVAVLGHAVSARAGGDFADVLAARVTDPLDLADTVVRPDGEVPAHAAQGHARSGQPVQPWSSEGYAPAGPGVWSTAADLGTLLEALVERTAPGGAAMEPRRSAGSMGRVGLGWLVTTVDGRPVRWHNGGGGGFRSFVAVDPDEPRAVAVLGNTDRPVDPVGWRLLGLEPPGELPDDRPWTLAILVFATATVPLHVLAHRQGVDRLGLAAAAVTTVALLAVARALGDWVAVSPLVWTSAPVPAAAALGWLLPGWRHLAVVRPRWRRVRLVGAALTGLVGLGLVVIVWP